MEGGSGDGQRFPSPPPTSSNHTHSSPQDDDPYVRKTAAICVAKLADIAPDLAEDRGFIAALAGLLGDANPMVVANAVAALCEIADAPGGGCPGAAAALAAPATASTLVRALNECTEWGQVFILDALAAYHAPATPAAAEALAERVAPRLQHANAAVVLSAVKVLVAAADALDDATLKAALHKKIGPPLITLLAAEPEVAYVALRNISLLVARYPALLAHEVRSFFVKYNDPAYIKAEKLGCLAALATPRTLDQVLLELREYAAEVDADFARRAVRAVGALAVRVEGGSEKCVNVLLDLVATRVGHVVQEAVVVIRDVFRRFPGKYESVISSLAACLDTLDEPDARAAMVWIIGEYADRIDNAADLLEGFVDGLPDEPPAVQLALVTAAVKLFLKQPTARPQALIQLVLTYATQESDDPDLRDRAFIYWRLLSADPEAAKAVVLADKPVIAGVAGPALDPDLVARLLPHMASLASVYHKPPEAFVSRTRLAVTRAADLEAAAAAAAAEEEGGGGGVSAPTAAADAGAVGPSSAAAPSPPPAAPAVPDLIGDLLGLDMPPAPAVLAGAAPAPTPAPVDDLLGGLGLAPAAPAVLAAGAAPAAGLFAPPSTSAPALPLLVPASQGKGLAISARLDAACPGGPVYRLRLSNEGSPLSSFQLQFNRNARGYAPAAAGGAVVLDGGLASIPVGGVATAAVPLTASPTLADPAGGARLQVAVRCVPVGVLYFEDALA